MTNHWTRLKSVDVGCSEIAFLYELWSSTVILSVTLLHYTHILEFLRVATAHLPTITFPPAYIRGFSHFYCDGLKRCAWNQYVASC